MKVQRGSLYFPFVYCENNPIVVLWYTVIPNTNYLRTVPMSDSDIYQTIPQREKLSDLVVDQLIQLIQKGKLKLGDRLPPERELAENFGVSRTVIRESIRSLVAKGLLDVRPGSGAVVSIPDSSLVAESMSMIMRLRAE
jgi:DNA-binding transcriptional regulator YhcF (GntR family)